MSYFWREVTCGVSCLDLMWNLVLLAYLVITIQAPMGYMFSIEIQQVIFYILCLIQIYSAARLFIAAMPETTLNSAICHIKTWKRIFVPFTLFYFIILFISVWENEDRSPERWCVQLGMFVCFIRIVAVFTVEHFNNLLQMRLNFPLDEVVVQDENITSKNCLEDNTDFITALK